MVGHAIGWSTERCDQIFDSLIAYRLCAPELVCDYMFLCTNPLPLV